MSVYVTPPPSLLTGDNANGPEECRVVLDVNENHKVTGPYLLSPASTGHQLEGHFSRKQEINAIGFPPTPESGLDSSLALLETRPRGGSFIGPKDWATESYGAFALQVLVPFFVCGFGNLGAGQLLNAVQHWPVFLTVTELYVLIPSLMGLKGNLEMTMASRLSTAANCGIIDDTKELWSMAKGNLALLQCQATIVGFLAAVVAILVDIWADGGIKMDHAFLLASSSVITANITSGLLSTIMIGVVIGSRKLNINPDNISTPIASSLGDVTTIAVLGYISSFFFDRIGKEVWLAPILMTIFLLMVPVTARYAHLNKYTTRVVAFGWTPIIVAMIISSGGGMILDRAIARFGGIASFQPVINGVGGNLVAIQASRLSTFLHQRFRPKTLPADDSNVLQTPCGVFCGPGPHAKVAPILFLMALPAQVIYFYIIILLQNQSSSLLFMGLYLSASLLQVVLLLYLARVLVFWLWRRGSDPDDSAIPLLTATGDLLGTGLLYTGFYILHVSEDPAVL